MRFEGLIVMERRIRGVVGLEDSEGSRAAWGCCCHKHPDRVSLWKADVAQEG